MLKYIIRRVLYMVPTVFGVILITLLLFSKAGGDPAKQRLGKQAKPAALEAYDSKRSLNKPLFAGKWGRCRAYDENDFSVNAGSWSKEENVSYKPERGGYILLEGKGKRTAHRHFDLEEGDECLWLIRCFVSEGGKADFVVADGDAEIARKPLPNASGFRSVKVPFTATGDPEKLVCRFEVESGSLSVGDLKFKRAVSHVFDSQLLAYLKQIAKFDFGTSLATNQKVSTMMLDGVLPSLSLTIPMFITSIVVSIVFALICAYLRNSIIDRTLVVVSVVLMSIPYLVWIILAQYWVAYRWHACPIWGYESWKYLVLPVMVGVISGLGGNIRFYRTVMLDEMYKDYVRTALAKGVSKPTLLFKHVLKNAMIPILTSVVMAIPFLYTGSLLLESFFGIPGLGSISINAINNSDYDVIRAVVFVAAMIYVVANLLTDICYAFVDPRVKLK